MPIFAASLLNFNFALPFGASQRQSACRQRKLIAELRRQDGQSAVRTGLLQWSEWPFARLALNPLVPPPYYIIATRSARGYTDRILVFVQRCGSGLNHSSRVSLAERDVPSRRRGGRRRDTLAASERIVEIARRFLVFSPSPSPVFLCIPLERELNFDSDLR